MVEAVIVSTARSPIGRAFKGSLQDMRPDDLAVQMVQAALAKMPSLDRRDIDDLMLGCGLPAGHSGHNMARVVPVLAGMDHLPGTTVNRYCSSSLQTTRMAFHAIKAGEGDVFISAGVESVSASAAGHSDGMPDTYNPLFSDAMRLTEELAPGWRRPVARPPRGRPAAGRLRRDGPDRGERRPAPAVPRASRTRSPCAARTAPRKRSPTASGNAISRRSPSPDGTVVTADDGPRAGVTLDGGLELAAGLPCRRHASPRATAARSTTVLPPS